MRIGSMRVSLAAGAVLLVVSATQAAAFQRTAYSDEEFDAALASGRPVLLLVSRMGQPGTACPDQWQMTAKLAEDPRTADALVMLVDADAQLPLRRFRIAYDCTLVAFRGGVETGRRLGTVDPARVGALFEPVR